MEALSSLQQAVLVGRPQQLAVREGAIPDWRQRLHLQGLELQAYLQSFVSSANNSVNAFLGMLGAATPSNKVLGDNRHKSQLFGFDKIAVCLSYSNALARSLGDESLPGVSLGEAMLQVIGLEVRPGSAILADTIGRIRWTAYLDTASLSATTDSAISFVKLLRSPVPLRINVGDGVDSTTVAQSSKSIESVTIIVGTADGQTFLWDINSDNGASTTQSRDDFAIDDNEGVCLDSSTFCHSSPVHRPYDATILQATSRIISASTEKKGVVQCPRLCLVQTTTASH